MTSPATGPLRLARAGVLTAVTMALSTAAHHAAGGALPGLLITALLAEVVWAAAYVCTRWRLSLPVLTVLLGAGQVLLHKAFMALAMPSGPTTLQTQSMSTMGGHGSAAASVTEQWAGPAVPSTTGLTATPGTTSTTVAMMLAHVAVTLALVLVLAAGEQALWRLWCWLTPMVLRLTALVPPLVFRSAPVRAAAPRLALVLRLLAADPRRGPPALPAG